MPWFQFNAAVFFFFLKVLAKETERKERLQYEQTKLAATVKEVKEAKKTHEAISGECVVMTAKSKLGLQREIS